MRLAKASEREYLENTRNYYYSMRKNFKDGCSYQERYYWNEYLQRKKEILGWLIDMDKPRPCPLCGNGVDLIEYDHLNGEKEYEIQCDCGIMTTSFDTIKELLAVWNTRASDKE